jgi:hypothetical protein
MFRFLGRTNKDKHKYIVEDSKNGEISALPCNDVHMTLLYELGILDALYVESGTKGYWFPNTEEGKIFQKAFNILFHSTKQDLVRYKLSGVLDNVDKYVKILELELPECVSVKMVGNVIIVKINDLGLQIVFGEDNGDLKCGLAIQTGGKSDLYWYMAENLVETQGNQRYVPIYYDDTMEFDISQLLRVICKSDCMRQNIGEGDLYILYRESNTGSKLWWKMYLMQEVGRSRKLFFLDEIGSTYFFARIDMKIDWDEEDLVLTATTYGSLNQMYNNGGSVTTHG